MPRNRQNRPRNAARPTRCPATGQSALNAIRKRHQDNKNRYFRNVRDKSGLADRVRELGKLLFDRIVELNAEIESLEKELHVCARRDEDAARLMTIPGVGPITAMALQAFAPPMESFRRGRDFAAWLGLVPRQHSTGGKPRLGKISKMGQRDLRRLLITGAMAVVRHATRRGVTSDPWLTKMLARKPRMLIAVALANRMARIVWALMTKKERYRAPAAA